MNREQGLKTAHGLMAVVFATCVAVQWNDPDAWLWMLVYGLAFIITVMTAFGRTPRTIAGLLTGVCILWALWLLPQVAGKVSLLALFDQLQMKTREVELGRELGGLMIILVWMTVVLLTDKRNSLMEKSTDNG